ncbi:transcription-repair coupling factor [Ligilactobacillus salitolerans]|uniref:Transcription-repair-coupling factor n=1 Tax=Ligilactobacillus salitolerans TaxID=1808352 RepID=A0A401IS08_9LACO|nr:transcription-repair coupling factor [Ligilactobacillus salitolerans]GBG94318.1 transcription-repair coupling factor [Ligilactobacillus salitolerans]
MQVTDLFGKIPEYQKWQADLTSGHHLLTGLSGSAKTVMLAELFLQKQTTQLIITDDLFHAQQLSDDLTNLLDENSVFLFPVDEMMAEELATSSPDFKRQRVLALEALQQDKPTLIVTATAGLTRFLPQPQVWQESRLKLKVGAQIDLKETTALLTTMGYTRQKMVERPGDFAVRGSILDIYCLNADYPVRCDLFDTEIDSLRFFDASDQRSVENTEEVLVLPATDFIAQESEVKQAEQVIKQAYEKQLSQLHETEAKQRLETNFTPIFADLAAGMLHDFDRLFASEILGTKTSLLDYLPASGLVIFDDYSRILDKENDLNAQNAEWLTAELGRQNALPNMNLAADVRGRQRADQHPQLFLSLFQKGMGQLRFTQMTDIKARAVQQFFGQMPLLKTEADRWQKQKQTVVIFVANNERLAKVSQTLDDFEIPSIMTKSDSLQEHAIQVVAGSLQNGFELPQADLVILTEHELFAKATKKQPKRQTMKNTERLRSYTDLKKGDFVVHVNHGIGKFMGMKTLTVSGKHQDYLTIDYQDDAQLFIPVTQLDRVQKYVSSEGKTPHVNKLGGSEWTKTKKRVAGKIEDIADELVELYAKRESEKGYAFGPDDPYQAEFEDAFPYTETPDQLRSAAEIKQDMMKPKPMDRLLIGDVGYGKTEVAMRAAFKAIQDGKQVAFLAPTTVLAQQHYETLVDRFNGFPVEIGILSRFVTKSQADETIKDLKAGMCDIVVGTHRLLSKDVKFADLGLLIIDEEQRFGVKHKEKLKQLKASVDVLTLTATPIPRTLNMSMLGVRDLSVIETAPMNRYPIQTYVMEQNYGVIVDAIKREMARGGQVFYLHNRVFDIEKTADELQALVPEARIAYIHGQMTETQMERILYDFINGEYDVLVTTTIIETGVDIPNANTLFVENADRMGLAQLYQLRGRVGRSNRVAYAYFMYQPDKILNEVSEKRLEAIKDFTELGSGFKIAMRDLSIRGAGNILGKQQHGFIDSVGYDLYTQMLNEAVAKKRGKNVPTKTDTEINLDIEAYLPGTYIEDPRQKIEIYKRVRQFESQEQYVEVQDDLIDRFGEYPPEVAALLDIGLLKMYSDQAMIESIKQQKKKIAVKLSKKATQTYSAKQLLKAVAETKFNASLEPDKDQTTLSLVIQPKMNEQDILEQLQALTKSLAAQAAKIQQKVAEK